MRINLTDNNIVANSYSRNDVAALFPIADKSISQLCRENENLLVSHIALRIPMTGLEMPLS